MTQKAFFEMLGAPLRNHRWSWGAVRRDGAVFLRVWEDRKRQHNGSEVVQVTHRSHYQNDESNPGHRERERHVELIRSGAPAYLVFCEAVDTQERPRRIGKFEQREVFPGGRMVDLAGDAWLEIGSPVPVKAVAR